MSVARGIRKEIIFIAGVWVAGDDESEGQREAVDSGVDCGVCAETTLAVVLLPQTSPPLQLTATVLCLRTRSSCLCRRAAALPGSCRQVG